MIAVNTLDASAQLQDAKPLLLRRFHPHSRRKLPQTGLNLSSGTQHLNMKAPGRPELFCKTNSNLFGRDACGLARAIFGPFLGLRGKATPTLCWENTTPAPSWLAIYIDR
jgi:hypothetical protein